MSAAMRHVAHLAIRNRGTIGGSLSHADPAAELPMLATFYDAKISVQGPSGRRTIAAKEFFVDALTNCLEPEEIVVEIEFPILQHDGWAFEEVARRFGDFALASIAVFVRRGPIRTGGRARRGDGRGRHAAAARGRRRTNSSRWSSTTAHRIASRRSSSPCVSPNDDLHASADYRKHLLAQLAKRAYADGVGGEGLIRMTTNVSVTVNGERYDVSDVEPRMLLSDFLRDPLGLTGTHVGCEHGVCGACTVLVNGDSARSCLMLAVQTNGAEIVTVEGLGTPEELNVLQAQFREHHGLQCGFCTPGMLMTGEDLLRKYPLATDEDIREGLSGNLCRCTGYQNIVAAIRSAAAMRTEKASMKLNFLAAGRLRMKKSIYVPGADRSETIDLPVEQRADPAQAGQRAVRYRLSSFRGR